MEALAPFRVGGCLLSSEPAPPLRNLRWCQVPVAIVSTDLHDWRAWTGRAQVTGAPQLHLEEPRPPRILLLKQQSGSEWSGCWGGVCVWGGEVALTGTPCSSLGASQTAPGLQRRGLLPLPR